MFVCSNARRRTTNTRNFQVQIIGRGLQFLGLTILPLGIVLELAGKLGRRGVAELLLIMVFGFAAFQLGRYLEGYGRHARGKV